MLKDSELGEKGAYQAFSHLFPKYTVDVSAWSSQHIPTFEQKAKVTLLSSERPICDPNYQPLYFKLSLDENILSRSSYEIVLNETDQTMLEGNCSDWDQKPDGFFFQHMLAEERFAKKVQGPEIWLKF